VWTPERDPGSTQLSLGGVLAPRLHTRAGVLGYVPSHWKADDLRRSRPGTGVEGYSEHIVRTGQLALFSLRRDWKPVAQQKVLPALTPAAQLVIDDVDRMAALHAWKPLSLSAVRRTLRILLSWLGADTPIAEDDVRALQEDHPQATAGRVLLILDEHHLLLRSPDSEKSADQRWVESHLDGLGDSEIRAELSEWVRVMRGEGRQRRRARSWEVIRKYLWSVLPTIRSWSHELTSLRQVTSDHVRAALANLTGTPAQGVRTGLRSVFVALRQQRLIFRDPTRTVRLASVITLPTALDDAQLRGLIDRGQSSLERAILALIAIHAMPIQELRSLAVDDVDFARATVTVTRTHAPTRVVHLDRLTARLLGEWIRERQSRWPGTENEHLFISANGAFSIQHPPVSATTIYATFRRQGLTPRRVRVDRILHEALVTEDPLHLMRVFGISVRSAVHYVHAAHPERVVRSKS